MSHNNVSVATEATQCVPVSEECLSQQPIITVDDIMQLHKPTSGYLVPRDANHYGIFFTRFLLKDEESGIEIFDIKLNEEDIKLYPTQASQSSDPTFGRHIIFHLPATFLELKHISALIEFQIGSKSVTNFRMIEKHYYNDTLLKEFDFSFPFCMPNSRNSCEQTYEVPFLSDEIKAQMIRHAYSTKSDSFYFVEGRLVMHHKAEFSFTHT